MYNGIITAGIILHTNAEMIFYFQPLHSCVFQSSVNYIFLKRAISDHTSHDLVSSGFDILFYCTFFRM